MSYTDGGGTLESVTSASTSVVANVNDDPTGGATITGVAAEDEGGDPALVVAGPVDGERGQTGERGPDRGFRGGPEVQGQKPCRGVRQAAVPRVGVQGGDLHPGGHREAEDENAQERSGAEGEAASEGGLHKGNDKDKFHLKITVKSKKLKSLSKIEANKIIYKSISDELKTHIHSIQLSINQ